MKKHFNITGTCYPKLHYIMENGEKLKEIMSLVKIGAYFTINRPRQYGKTTTLHFLMTLLESKTDYLAIRLTFEDVRDKAHLSDDAFAQMVMRKMQKHLSEKMQLFMIC